MHRVAEVEGLGEVAAAVGLVGLRQQSLHLLPRRAPVEWPQVRPSPPCSPPLRPNGSEKLLQN